MQLLPGLTFVLMAITGRIAALPVDDKLSLEGIPLGSPDGIYVGSVKNDGSTLWEYRGRVEQVSPLASRSNSSVVDIAKPNYVACAGFGINGNDASNAQNNFVNMCGGGGYYFGGRSIAVVSGSAVAYGCNYGNGQTCHVGDIAGFFSQVNGQCGVGEAGWYSANNWKASYGRTSTGSGFCG